MVGGGGDGGHGDLDSSSFFGYLRPADAALAAALSPGPAAAANASRGGSALSDDAAPDTFGFVAVAPSRLLARVLRKRRREASPDCEIVDEARPSQQSSAAAGATSSTAGCAVGGSEGAAATRDAIAISSDSAAGYAASSSAASGACGATACGARDAVAPRPADGLLGLSGASACSALPQRLVVHECSVPLAAPQTIGGCSARHGVRGRGRGRGRGKGRGRGRGGAPEDGSLQVAVAPALPLGWQSVSLADVLFQLGASSPGLADFAGQGPPLADAWRSQVRSAGGGGTFLRGFAAVREALRHLRLEALLPLLMEASWPAHCQDWQSLPAPERSLSLSDWAAEDGELDMEVDLPFVCQLDFRSEACSEQQAAEAFRLRFSFSPVTVASRLLGAAQKAGERDDTRPTARHAEWRAAPATRKSKRWGKNSTYKLLDNRDDILAEQPPHFKHWPLRREQLRSLHWMQEQEVGAEPFDLIVSQLSAEADGSVDDGGNKPTKKAVHALRAESKSGNPACGWRYEFRCREVYPTRGGILGDAMGYGKTATTIGLIDSQKDTSASTSLPANVAPYFFKSKATLILVPSNLLLQWLSEINKFLGSGGDCGGDNTFADQSFPLKVVAIKTTAQLKSATVRQLCSDADIVLCSYRLLYSPVYRRRLLELSGNTETPQMGDAAVLRATINMLSLRRNTRRLQDDPEGMDWLQRLKKNVSNSASVRGALDGANFRFPVLEQFWWKRIVFDEFHELEAMGDTAQFESLRNLCGHHRWGLTGTPPTRDLDQISTLARLFQIGRLPSAEEDYELAHSMAQRFLDHFARQNTSTELPAIRLREHIVDVRHTPEERALYLQARFDNEGTVGGAATSSDSERLLRLCSHFAGGAAGSSDAGAECMRILTSKRQKVDHASKLLAVAAAAAERSWRRMALLGGDAAASGLASRELAMETLRRRFNVRMEAQPAAPAAPSSPASPSAVSSTAMPATPSASPGAETSCSPAYTHILEALELARHLSDKELQASCKAPTLQRVTGESADLVPAADHSRMDIETESRGLQGALLKFTSVVEAYDTSTRSLAFFDKSLAATRGENSAEHRTCSICLDEDIPCEDLSITVCSHVFCTSCIEEVAVKVGSCPVCRHCLKGKDITPVAREHAAADQSAASAAAVAPTPARGGKKRAKESSRASCDKESLAVEEIVRRFGSKLGAIVARLKEIERKGEKAIVFCQWEDLKRQVAAALGACGVRHYQLLGSACARGETIRRFQEERGDEAVCVLLLSLESAASGTNLTAASHVVFVHPMSAASAERAVSYEAQAIGRIRRWGQERPEVHCWRFVTRGTVEETLTAEHRRELWDSHLRSGAAAS